MIGKTLYKAKIRDGKVIMQSNTIVTTERKYHYFGGKLRCLKSDVGVVCFLTKTEAMDYLVKRLERSIDMGEEYVKKEKSFLSDVKQMLHIAKCIKSKT